MNDPQIEVVYRNRVIESISVFSGAHTSQYLITYGPMMIHHQDGPMISHVYPSLRDAYNHAGYYERESLHDMLATLPHLAHENGFMYDLNVRAWVQGNPALNVIIV
jgi:hypothetical protein